MDQEQENDKLRMINDCCPCYAVTKHRKKYNGISRQKKKREDAITIQNVYQKWNCPLDVLKKNLTVFCHFVTVKNISNGHKKVSLRQTIKIKALMSLLVKVGLFKIKWGL